MQEMNQQAQNNAPWTRLNVNSVAGTPVVREREIHDALGSVDRELEALRSNLSEFISRLSPVLRPEDANSTGAAQPVVATPVGRRIQAQHIALADVNSALRTALDRLEV